MPRAAVFAVRLANQDGLREGWHPAAPAFPPVQNRFDDRDHGEATSPLSTTSGARRHSSLRLPSAFRDNDIRIQPAAAFPIPTLQHGSPPLGAGRGWREITEFMAPPSGALYLQDSSGHCRVSGTSFQKYPTFRFPRDRPSQALGRVIAGPVRRRIYSDCGAPERSGTDRCETPPRPRPMFKVSGKPSLSSSWNVVVQLRLQTTALIPFQPFAELHQKSE